MDDLKSLIELVSKNKVKQIEIINQGQVHSTSNWMELYDGISKNKFSDEEEASNYFYGTSKYKERYFKRLKRNLKERLINTLFFIDVNQPSFTDTQRAYYTCYKNAAAVKILLGRYGRKHAIPLAEKTLNIALDFEFTDIALSLSKDLRTHYNSILGDRKKGYKYHQILNKQKNLFLAEIKAEEYYSDLSVNYVNSKATKPEVAKMADRYSNELRELIKENNSIRLYFLSYLVFTLQCELENDFKGTLKISREVITYFKSKKVSAPPSYLWNFSLKILQSLTQLNRFEEGEKVAEECKILQEKGSGNWFASLHYIMILHLRSIQFEKAFNTYIEATNQKNYKKLPPFLSEPWRIHEAFIFYFIRIGKIQVPEKQKLKSFRINKFLNEMPTYSKDKYGINITILILHILFLLLDGRYGEIIDRTESLKTYTHRYLRKDHTFRSNCFIKMLMQLPASSFHKEAVVRKAEKYKKKLLSVPLEEANQSVEIEIVPYEMLWEFVLDSLDNKFHHANK